jgi:hypothetical protein
MVSVMSAQMYYILEEDSIRQQVVKFEVHRITRVEIMKTARNNVLQFLRSRTMHKTLEFRDALISDGHSTKLQRRCFTSMNVQLSRSFDLHQ